MGGLVSDKEWQIINDSEHSWLIVRLAHRAQEREVDLVQSEKERMEHTNLRILE